MNSFWLEAFSPANIVFTVLLLVVLFYWLLVLLGGLDLGDADLDIDAEADLDVEAGGLSWLGGALQFFHFGKMPFMVILSLIIVPAWMLNMLANHYLGGGSLLFAAALFFPVLFVSMLLAKVLSYPLLPVFKALDTAEEALDYIGMQAVLTLPASPDKSGQARILHQDAPLLLTVRTEPDGETLTTGQQVLITRRADIPGLYLVRKLTTE